MSTITATVDAAHSLVRLDIDFSDVAPVPTITVTRTRLDTGASVTIRPYGALLAGLPRAVGGKLVLYDTEAPLDVPLQYTAAYNSGTGLVQLNVNSGFENGILAPWGAAGSISGGTVADSQTQAQAGYWAIQFTPDGVTANPAFHSELVPAVPGQVVTAAGQLWTTNAFTWSVGIGWYNGSGGFLSAATFNVALSAATWTAYLNSATAPASTAFCASLIAANGTPIASNLLYGDQLAVSTPVNVTVTSTVVILPSNGYAWLRDPARPANSVRLDAARRPVAGWYACAPGQGVAYLGLTAKTRRFMGTLLDVNNSPLPVGITRVRRAPGFDLRLGARSFVDRDLVTALVQPGSALMLQLPAVYGEPDRYVQPLDVPEALLPGDQRRQNRIYDLPVNEVGAPVGPMLGSLGQRISDLSTHYPAWGALQAVSGGAYDQFARTVAAGNWGTPDVGATWSVAGTAADFSTNGTVGLIAVSVVNTQDRATTTSQTNPEQYVKFVVPVVATGAGMEFCLLARNPDASNHYRVGVRFGLAGATTIIVTKRVAAVETVVASVAGPTYSAGQTWFIHAQVNGTALSVSAWPASSVEPVAFQVATTDAALGASGPCGVLALLLTGNTNTLPVSFQVDDYQLLGTLTWQQILDGAIA